MQVVSGTFNGIGAAITGVGIGFIPDKVEFFNIESTVAEHIIWCRNFRNAVCGGGMRAMDDNDDVWSEIACGSGIRPYDGGDVVTAAQYSSSDFLYKDPDPDKRADGATGTITTFTMDTPASLTGHFDQETVSTIVDVGSMVCIDGRWYTIMALTSNGEQANEVTLDRLPKNTIGEVTALTGAYDWIVAPAGTRMPAGFAVDVSGEFNKSGEQAMFIAYKF